MFENIIAQASVVERLQTEVRAQLVPPTLLFCGPDYAGKSSTALELARAITCTSGDSAVPWACSCRSCTQQRHLLHPETLLLGGRYFHREISVAAAAVKRNDIRPLRFLLERSVRKLTRRFDSVLWEGDTARVKKADPILEKLDEALAPYLPDSAEAVGRDFAKGLDDVVDLCGKLAGVTNLDAVPVDVIRRLSAWSHISPRGPAKVAILENVDRLGDSARNALLKTLEEPPGGVYFVLTTQRKGAVMATILSRSRVYGFGARDVQESHTVIKRIFRDETADQTSIRDYFMGMSGYALRPLADRFVRGCLAETELELGLLAEIEQAIGAVGAQEGFLTFAVELTELFREALRAGDGTKRRVVQAWQQLLSEWIHRVESYRIQPGRALEAIYYGMRDVA
ncbi:MAG: DNA polymerase III [Spirochaetales bacterium]